MSYDYNALVASIAVHRRKAAESDDPLTHIQRAVDTFATLSSHCPMTPLLWMQYAHDTSRLMQLLLPNRPQQAAEMRHETLELAMEEFPGCALLHLHYLQLLMEQKNDDDTEKLEAAFDEAIAAVGRGSHRNEGHLVAAMYRLYTTYVASQNDKNAMDAFVQRAQTPMKDANDGLVSEIHDFCQMHNIKVTPNDLQRIEDARRWTAKTFDSLAANENDVDVAMHAEGILTRHDYSHQDMDWEALLKSESGRLWMGFGGVQTANAFINYAKACSYFRVPQHEVEQDEEEAKKKRELVHSLALAVYERGVAECPTVESLWLSYLRHLMYLISTKNPLASVSRLESVASRAVRNCPYSVQLLQEKIKAFLLLAEAGQVVFDPDSLTAIVENSIKSKFLPNPVSQLELHMTAIRTVKRRIMSILARTDEKGGGKYDDATEQNGKKHKNADEVGETELGEEAEQEVQDLVEDIREMYDAADVFLRKNHASWSEGRTILWKDRATTETYLLGPLIASLEGTGETNAEEGLRCFAKLVKIHQPPHPDSYAMHIREFMNQSASAPRQVMRNLQTTRYLFQKALKTVGKLKEEPEASSTQRDRTTALQCLCHDYLEFEQLFGSDESYVEASKSVRKKFETLETNGSQQEKATPDGNFASESKGVALEGSVGSKRMRSEDASDQAAAKKSKSASPTEDVEMKDATEAEQSTKDAAANSTMEMSMKHAVLKVHVGKLDYPAHPFTVRVMNLADETEDMDLVDLFRPKCGAVVHAKIVREKNYRHGKGKSKGWGLVQFEERYSVEKALELNDVIGIHEHIVKVDRSHVPAVGLVPPGMHRVKPPGEGKASKRNQKKRERKMSRDENLEDEPKKDEITKADGEGAPTLEAAKPKASSNAGILAFRPRGVAHGHSSAHRKVKLSLGNEELKD